MYFPTIDEIEDLQHDEGVENKGEMSRIDAGLVVRSYVVVTAGESVESAAANIPADNPTIPLPFWMGRVVQIKIVSRFWYEELSPKDKNDHNNNLKDALSDDMLHHHFRNHMLISTIRPAVEQVLSGRLRGKRQRSQGVHNEVYP